MLTLAKLSIRRPKLSLVTWLIVAAALTAVGFGVSSSLSPSITTVPGTQSSRALSLANAQFGPTQLVPILLEGPKGQLNTEGPKLVTALAKRPHTRVLSAWDTGPASSTLRPSGTQAMIVVSVDRSEKAAVQYDEPQIERLVAQQIAAPVKAYVTGQPSIDRALKSAATSDLRTTELIACGILFLLLLVGLRAPIAAAIVTGVGAISMLSGFGEVALLGKVLSLDPLGVSLGTMTGLALGVAFALLILDRFHREEFDDRAHPREVAAAAIRELEGTGRAVLVGGTAVVLALALVAIIGPSQLMVSLGTGMLTCAAFATGGAVVVMPAALVLLGHRINRFSFPAPALLTRAWERLQDGGNWVTRHAVYTGFAATVILALLAVPAFALNSGAPSITQLPANSKARLAFEEVSRVMGPGWPTPYNIIVVARNQPITTPAMLTSLQRLERQVATDPAVDSVTGPGGAFTSTASQLSAFGPSLAKSAKISDRSKQDLLKLIAGLGQAGSGSAELQSGLKQAASGAGQLTSGSGQIQSGAGQLHSYLVQARSGSAQLQAGLNQAYSAAVAIKNGAGQALAGANKLSAGLGAGAPQVKNGLPAVKAMASASSATVTDIGQAKASLSSAQTELSNAVSALGASSAKADPNVIHALSALAQANGAVGAMTSALASASKDGGTAAFLASSVSSQVATLSPQLTEAAAGAAQLAAGIKQLRDYNGQLAAGIGQLNGGGKQLTSALSQLTSGAGTLQTALAQLTSGAGTLEQGLAAGVSPAGQLIAGLSTMQAAVVKSRGQIPSTAQLKQLQAQSPGLFDSGYFVLAAVAGATASQRTQASFTINLNNGGTAGQIMVVSKYASNDGRSTALASRLVKLGSTFGKQQNAEVALGGPAGNLGDLTSVTKSRVWLDVAVLAAAIFAVLALALRALVLPAVATAFSLLVAAATFGVLQLLVGGQAPPLGGPGYLDPMTIIGIFTIAFGVTVVFATVLLMRTREAYVAGGSEPTRRGLRETGAAATGAGLVMIAALIPFLTSDLINVRVFGIGVAVAVLIDIAVIRPVLLPAAETVLGRLGWWPTRRPGQGHSRPPEWTPRRSLRFHLRHAGPSH